MNQRRLTSLVLGSDLRFTHQFWLLLVSPSKHFGSLMKFRDKINRSGAKPGLCLIPRAQYMVSYFTKSLIHIIIIIICFLFFHKNFSDFEYLRINSWISVHQILLKKFFFNFYLLHFSKYFFGFGQRIVNIRMEVPLK